MASPLSLDFDRLEVGDGFRSQGRTITESDLVSFAALTGDRHPLHTDAEWAAASEFGSRIAHGSMVLSYCVGLVPFDPRWVLALRGFERVAFKRPVRIGDTIHVEGEIESLREIDGLTGLAVFAWRVVNQRGDAVVLAKARVVWRREAEPAAAAASAGPAREEVFL
ncbi:MAG TPA: MaoC/PaaZ C-terminal domain-containing protein [Solirubrobacterales bacterium]|nr:MaoC/PaaZ C-terminal domain-containing protein [Solirubrobacterales bacterium]